MRERLEGIHVAQAVRAAKAEERRDRVGPESRADLDRHPDGKPAKTARTPIRSRKKRGQGERSEASPSSTRGQSEDPEEHVRTGRWVRGIRQEPDRLMEIAQSLSGHLEPTLAEVLHHSVRRTYQHALGPWRTLEIPALGLEERRRRLSSRRGSRGRDPGVRVEYLAVIVGPNLLITITPGPLGPAQELERALAETMGADTDAESGARGQPCSVGRALTALLALATERIQPTVRRLEVVTGRLEAAKPRTQTDSIARAILVHKRRLAVVGQCLGSLRDGVALLEENPPKGMGPHFGRRLRDVDRHVAEALHLVEAERDQVSAILSYHLSAASNRVNEVIKTLTVLATVITPFTVISGIYGMNFAIPETHWRFGYAFALGLMALSTGFLLWFFRRHHWI